jgi:hypothetical protein
VHGNIFFNIKPMSVRVNVRQAADETTWREHSDASEGCCCVPDHETAATGTASPLLNATHFILE